MPSDDSTTVVWLDNLNLEGRVLLLANDMLGAHSRQLREQVEQLIVMNTTERSVVGRVEALPFASASFDAVIANDILHTQADLKHVLGECSRILRMGATLVVWDVLLPNHKKSERYVSAFEQYRNPAYHRAYPLYRWKDALGRTGFDLDEWRQMSRRMPLFMDRERLSSSEQQRLQALLLRAPQRVQDWLQPDDASTHLAQYHQQMILMKGTRNE